MKVSITSHKGYSWLTVGGLLVLWAAAAAWLRLPLLLPSPWQTGVQIAALLGTAAFWAHLGATVSRGLLGFGAAFLAGTVFGLQAGRRAWFEALIRPLVVFARSTPSMSFILLALIWFKGDMVPIFVIFLVVFPIIIQNMIEGVRSIDRELLEMASVYRLTKPRILRALVLPSLAPFLAAAVSAGLGLTWRVLIAAEVLSYPKWGIGGQMDSARVFLQTDRVFAWTVVVVAIGLSFDSLLGRWLNRILAWRGTNDDSSMADRQKL
ncbi:NitT/TauT family transport system permease protein [Hydrogenispora ethanolica]|uniref:NitT/TauT family transport system permease protein n=1 Tax=Hydrogenispora ethanolica TaxID=1082276 RepID=A0A4R1S7E9_HYDET|nr:ABC transporter permease subunit [Hydrogenispora ethanolica]TCL75258.1 NitT/TauT family transport system permease protein [Hydrogenispora ethanolica]